MEPSSSSSSSLSCSTSSPRRINRKRESSSSSSSSSSTTNQGENYKRLKLDEENDESIPSSSSTSSTSSTKNIIHLSDDVVLMIFNYLDNWSLFQVIMSNIGRLGNVASDNSLWINVDFGNNYLHPPSLMDYKKIFHRYIHSRTKSITLLGFLKSKFPDRENLSGSLLEIIKSKSPNLETLNLREQYIDGAKISITNFPKSLINLSMHHCEVTNPAKESYFKDIHNNLKNLKILSLKNNTWLTNHSLLALCKIETLEELDLQGCWRIGECFVYTALATKFGFRNVKKIDVRETSIGNSEVPCFGRLPKVTHVYFGRDSNEPTPDISESEGDGRISDRGIASIIEFDDSPPSLTHLGLRRTEVTDKMLERLAIKLRLQFLDVRGTRITEGGIERFKLKNSNCVLLYDMNEQ